MSATANGVAGRQRGEERRRWPPAPRGWTIASRSRRARVGEDHCAEPRRGRARRRGVSIAGRSARPRPPGPACRARRPRAPARRHRPPARRPRAGDWRHGSCRSRCRRSGRSLHARPRTLDRRAGAQAVSARASAAVTVCAAPSRRSAGRRRRAPASARRPPSATSGWTSPTSTLPFSRERRAACRLPSGNRRSTVALVGQRVDADVDHRRARLDERRGVTKPGRPTAATRMSAVAGHLRPGRACASGRSVTVASRCSSSSAIGLPTMSLRPMHDRVPARASGCPRARAARCSRAACRRPAPGASAPAGRRCTGGSRPRPWPGRSRRRPAARRRRPCPAGSGDCTRMPSIAVVGVQRPRPGRAPRRAWRRLAQPHAARRGSRPRPPS